MMESVFRNVYTWIREVSTTYVLLEILEQLLFGLFQNTCFNYLAKSVLCPFCKTPRLSCSICFSLLRRFLPFLAPLWKVYL